MIKLLEAMQTMMANRLTPGLAATHDVINPPVHQLVPVHQQVYGRIREMVLYGELIPGQSVTIQGLVSTLNSGMTPVREAIRRLTAEGALQATDTRRILVPELNLQLLEELTFARLAIEPELARLATHTLTSRHIDRLAAIDSILDDAIENGDTRGYLHYNYAFHSTLYAHSGAEILTALADTLWLRAGPSLRVVCGRLGTQNLPDKHGEALAAMRAGDADGVAQAIHDDIEQGHGQVAKTLQSL